jgi:hypothetical protein
MKKLLLTSLFLFATTSINAATVNLVTNGSFENPDVAPGKWKVFNSIDGWNTIGAGVEVRDNAVGKAYKGSQFVELDSHASKGTPTNSAIYQTFSNTLAGKMYQISFAYSPRIKQKASTNGISVFWNDVELKTVTANGGKTNLWTIFTLDVLATGQSDVLKFAAVGKDDRLGGNLDDISLTALAAVPVPATLFLLAPALAGFIGLRRKTKKTAV